MSDLFPNRASTFPQDALGFSSSGNASELSRAQWEELAVGTTPHEKDRPLRPLSDEEWRKTVPLAKYICRTAVAAMTIHELDYVDLVLYMLVATTCMERLFGQAKWLDATSGQGNQPAGAAMPSLSRISLSEDTRLPRETVRRRVALLIEKGWLAEDRNGFLTVTPERFFNPANEALFRFMLDEHAQLLGAFDRSDEKPAPRPGGDGGP